MDGIIVSLLALLAGILPAAANAQYLTETRAMTVSSISRSYLLARPATTMPAAALPLLISLHGDGGNSAGMRSTLPLETAATQGGPMGCNLVTCEDPGISTPVKAACARNAGFGAAISRTHLSTEPAGQRDPLLQAIREHYLQ